VDFKDATH